MPPSRVRLVEKCAEFRWWEQMRLVPRGIRGIYALLQYRRRLRRYDVVYVGMAGGDGAGIRDRLKAHRRSKRKGKLWTHFSIFKVWDNIREDEIQEFEGLLRHIYRKDTRANKLNRQRRFRKLVSVRVNDLRKWSVGE